METWKRILGLAIAGIVMVGFTGAALAKNKFEQELDKEKEAVALVMQAHRGGYFLIATEEFKRLVDSKKDILIVDTMPYEESFKKEHIPGAKNFLFPVTIMENWNEKETGGKTRDDFAALLGADKNKTIVFYCGFVKSTRSHNAAAWARKLGYKNVYRQPGGIFAWKGAKYPLDSVK